MRERSIQTNPADKQIGASLQAYQTIAASRRADRQVEVKTGGGFFSHFKREAQPVISREHALRLAGADLQRSMVARYGDWGWRVLQSRVPELDRPSQIKDVDRLKGKLEAACRDIHTLAGAIDDILRAPGLPSDDPIVARNFEEYEEGLQKRGALLASEFSPPSAGWSVAAELAGLPRAESSREAEAIGVLMNSSVRAFIRDNGKLPSRLRMIEFAVAHASVLAGGQMHAFDVFEANRDAVQLGPNSQFGQADFPTEALRKRIDALTEAEFERIDRAVGAANPHAAAYLEKSIQATMKKVWNEVGTMLEGHGQALEAQFKEIDEDPRLLAQMDGEVATSKVKDAMEQAKLRLLMPGSRLFEYLATHSEPPALGPEALHAYKRDMVEHLRGGKEMAATGFLALSAYTAAQERERAKAGPRDAATLQTLDRMFKPELAEMMRKNGEIDTYVLASSATQAAFLQAMSKSTDKRDESGYDYDFVTDIDRSTWVFDNGSEQHTVPTGAPRADSLARYQAFFEGDKKAAQTLSQLLHQNSIGLFMKDWLITAHSLGDPTQGSDDFCMLIDAGQVDTMRAQFNGGYTLRRLATDKVEVEFDHMRPATQLAISGSAMQGSTVPINRAVEFDGEVTAENAAIHQHFKVQFDLKDLKAGVLKPSFSQVPQTHLQIRPDWGQIAQARENAGS